MINYWSIKLDGITDTKNIDEIFNIVVEFRKTLENAGFTTKNERIEKGV